MLAKSQFISNLVYLKLVFKNDYLINKELDKIEHNEIAKLLRRGIAIVSFNLLEDFIKNRLGEIFSMMHESHLGFSDLPERIQNSATMGALKATLYRSKLLKQNNEDWMESIQKQSGYISSTSTASYQLSEYSLGWDKPNIVCDDIATFLKIFGAAAKPFEIIEKICHRIGISIPSPKESYINATKRRHMSAHSSDFDPNYSNIYHFTREMIAIALSLDIIFTYGLTLIKDNDEDYINGSKKINSDSFIFRFIDKESETKWREIKEGSRKATKIYASKNEALIETLGRKLKANEFVVVRSEKKIPTEWHYK